MISFTNSCICLIVDSVCASLLKEVPFYETKRNMAFTDDTKSRTSALTNTNLLQANEAAINKNSPSVVSPIFSTSKGDLTNLIGVGLIGALNTNGHSNTSALASNLFASGSSVDESSFNKRLLSRFGCYLIISLINPSEFTSDVVSCEKKIFFF